MEHVFSLLGLLKVLSLFLLNTDRTHMKCEDVYSDELVAVEERSIKRTCIYMQAKPRRMDKGQTVVRQTNWAEGKRPDFYSWLCHQLAT